MGEEETYEESNQCLSSPELSAAEPAFRLAIELINSLISLSHSIRAFAVKWQSIRSKLEELLPRLIAVEKFDSGENSSLSGKIGALLETLNECTDLARRCVDLSYNGKLLMQSDLDIICTKIDAHIASFSEAHSAGLLRESHAIVVSRPGFAASRDDMRFYVRDLLSRLKVGDAEFKKQALISFIEIIQEDYKYIKFAVEIGSFIGFLVKFLDSQVTELQEEAAKAVSVIAGFDSYKGVLVGAGAIAPLIRVLESGSEMGKELSARCLQKLTENADNAWSVSAQGGVTALLKISTDCNFGGELVNLACGVLKNLVGVEEIKKFMVEEGSVPAFVRLLRSKDEASQISSMEFLQAMAFGDETIRQMIVKEGGIRLLVRVLDPNSSSSLKAREMALRAILNLCFSTGSFLIKLLMSYGFMDHILYFLRNGEISVQELALKAAFRLSGTSEEAKKAMGDAGFMPELVKLLRSRSFEAREMAAEALSAMVSVQRNKKRFVQNDQNVHLLMQMLDPEGNPSTRKSLLSILMALASCNIARKKIVHSGYLKNIEKLAEAEVSDAKKIVRKLSSNRFRSLLRGIWHS